jgi:predicted CoA-substrate-specific enzyme activase
MKLYLGFDIGSVSINTVVMDEKRNIIDNRYDYCYGKPFALLRDILLSIIKQHRGDSLLCAAATGTGGPLASELIGAYYVNEIVAQSAAVAHLYPQIRTIIEMGGEDSKLLFMESENGNSQLVDFVMNSICAAGTGSFLDQQARRIGVSIEDEFGQLALQSINPPRIAGRCSVFAKSDMIHLQQIATPVHDIVAGLCFAVARNFKSQLARGKLLPRPIIFQGGVAANAGMIRAFKEVLDLEEKELIIPEYYASMGAIGSLYHLFDNPPEGSYHFRGLAPLDDHLTHESADLEQLNPLEVTLQKTHKGVVRSMNPETTLEVWLGLDVGSLSTNVVLIDRMNRVVARRYLPTSGKPLEAIKQGLKEIYDEVGDGVRICGAGTTGSGRYLTGDFIGADTIQNEITAQATAAIDIDPEVDTIFEIGGQDSKFISIDNGVIVDFEMNKVCAAGTGSFLEEQAEKLGVNIIDEFGNLAISAHSPSKLGDRCTVFMESDLNAHQQKGAKKENLVAGLAYSIVYNYIQKVVGNKRIADRIFFQGGVANNTSVVAAFEKVTGRPIVVPAHHDVTGAIGAAMLSRDVVSEDTTRFKGFSISQKGYAVDKFGCKSCSNRCEIRRVKIEGETRPLYYGGRCERYEAPERKGRGKDIPNLFQERTKLLIGDYRDAPVDHRTSIGIPRGLMLFYQQFPFWRTFFEELGFRVVLSPPSSHALITRSLELIAAETCFPVEVMHGHVYKLFDMNVDYIWLPSVVNSKAEADNPTIYYNCPWVQTIPYMIKAAIKWTKNEDRLLTPAFHFRYFGRVLNREISAFMQKRFDLGRHEVIDAVEKADAAQEDFERKICKFGREVLDNLPQGKEVVVVMGRPYNTNDPELNLYLVQKLINLEVLPIPMDLLPWEQENIYDDYRMMYWPNGRKILAASRIIAKDQRLHAVFLGNFRCGPDSFLLHFIREELKGRPYLQLEVDEHSADAGMITRCEAFLDSLRNRKKIRKIAQKRTMSKDLDTSLHAPIKERVLYVPYMSDHAYMLAAGSRHCGVSAEVLPPQDSVALELGRKYTSSRECFPMICTTGSFLKKAMEPGFDPKSSSFFMPDHNGPCRFGQYNRLQRIILDRIGFLDVKIISPGNDNAYTDLSGGQGKKFWVPTWKGTVAVDILRKLVQERRPYEVNQGECNECYQKYLREIIRSVEGGAKDLEDVLLSAARAFGDIEVTVEERKPVISVTGEIFMRDNPFCSGYVVQKLERLGAETMIAPIREWFNYSTYRYFRDSVWKRNIKGIIKSRYLRIFQHISEHRTVRKIADFVDLHRDIHIKDVLHLCNSYVDKSYDGEPALIMGTSAGQVATGISGIVNILPFTCMPGTLITSISGAFRKDYDNIPWVNVVYDGQEDTGIDTRLQAFMHQAKEYARRRGLNQSRKWKRL